MSAISDLPKKKKVLLAIAVALIVVAGGLFAFQGSPEEKKSSGGLTAQQIKEYEEADKKKEDNLKSVLGVINNVYRSQGEAFPDATEKGWSEVLDTVPITDIFADPYTKTIYQFTDPQTNPDFGQVQYAPGYACKKDGKTLTKGFGEESLALRARFTDGYRCVNNFQG
jgi:hypothetical protein